MVNTILASPTVALAAAATLAAARAGSDSDAT